MSRLLPNTCSKLQFYLPLAGALPFVAAATLSVLGVSALPWGGSVISVLMIYGLIIASFMAGVHWGQQLNLPNPIRTLLAVVSNIVALLLWGVFLSGNTPLMIIALAFTFVVLLLIDTWLSAEGVIHKHYLNIRAVVTTIVVGSLGVVGVQL